MLKVMVNAEWGRLCQDVVEGVVKNATRMMQRIKDTYVRTTKQAGYEFTATEDKEKLQVELVSKEREAMLGELFRRGHEVVFFFDETPGVPAEVRGVLADKFWTAETLPIFPGFERIKLGWVDARPDEVIRITAQRMIDIIKAQRVFKDLRIPVKFGEVGRYANKPVYEDIGFNLLRREFGFVARGKSISWLDILEQGLNLTEWEW